MAKLIGAEEIAVGPGALALFVPVLAPREPGGAPFGFELDRPVEIAFGPGFTQHRPRPATVHPGRGVLLVPLDDKGEILCGVPRIAQCEMREPPIIARG